MTTGQLFCMVKTICILVVYTFKDLKIIDVLNRNWSDFLLAFCESSVEEILSSHLNFKGCASEQTVKM